MRLTTRLRSLFLVGTCAWGLACSADDSAPNFNDPATQGTTDAEGETSPSESGSSTTESDPSTTDASSTTGDSDPTSDPSSTSGSTGDGAQTEDVPVVINFDDLDSFIDLTTQYAEYATFSSDPGSENRTMSGLTSSEPNFICATSRCDEPTYLDFTHPVSNLKLVMVQGCDTALAHIFVDGTEAAVVTLDAMTCQTTTEFDLSEFENVTRLELTDITEDSGVGWDDFSFTAHVPVGS